MERDDAFQDDEVHYGASKTLSKDPTSVLRRRCNARGKHPPLRYCRNWRVPGRHRCRLHSGLSTGPTTPEGMARTVAAMLAGRRRWLVRLKSEGQPIPCGRKKGGRNAPLEERELMIFASVSSSRRCRYACIHFSEQKRIRQ
jgi:hypothetical protein